MKGDTFIGWHVTGPYLLLTGPDGQESHAKNVQMLISDRIQHVFMQLYGKRRANKMLLASRTPQGDAYI